MSGHAWPQRDGIIECLVKWGAEVTQVGSGCWIFTVANGRSAPVTARLADDFLLLDATGGRVESPKILQALLAAGDMLPGACKFVFLPAQCRVHLRAEIVCDEATDFSGRVPETLDGFRAACGVLHDLGTCEFAGAEKAIRPGSSAQFVPDAITQALKESGWKFSQREEGSVAVELETPGGFHQALLESNGGGVRLTLDLSHAAGVTLAARQALSALLLIANGAVRLVRGFLEHRDDELVAGFRVEYASAPGAGELEHALSALSVAGRLCAREAKILHDEPTARLFLAVYKLGRTTNRKESNHGKVANHAGLLAQGE
jgi:hypothetical protein